MVAKKTPNLYERVRFLHCVQRLIGKTIHLLTVGRADVWSEGAE